jgi:hypothetical protein
LPVDAEVAMVCVSIAKKCAIRSTAR